MAGVAEAGRALTDAFNRRDVPAMQALVSEDFVMVPLRAALEDVVYEGKEGLAAWVRDVDSAWSELRIEFGEVREVSEHEAVAEGRVVGRGHESDAPVEMKMRWNSEFRDGVFSRIETVIER